MAPTHDPTHQPTHDTRHQSAHEHGQGLPMTGSGPDAWDERYAALDQVWSGQPNGALVAEVSGLPPGTVLDVGCGEGADAVWLARRGWDVTALDVSRVALDRAEAHAREAGVEVRWRHCGLVEAAQDLESGFDLVSAQYPALGLTRGRDAERALAGAVAPGGVLLFVHHLLTPDSIERSREHGFDPDDYLGPAGMAEFLRAHDGWVVEVDEQRPRQISGGSGAHHADDLVLRARRRG